MKRYPSNYKQARARLRAPAAATQAARSNAAFSTLINVVRARAVAGRASLGQQKVD